MSSIRFNLHEKGKITDLDVMYDSLYAIGYAGRNIEKTMEHIKELEEKLGVPAPKLIPTIFQMSNMLLTKDKDIDFVGNDTCGEVEYIIITQGEKIYIGLGSDHTDRKLEAQSVPKAKQVAPKPIAVDVWNYEEIKDHWDDIKLVSYQLIDGKEVVYQEGSLADILPVESILEEMHKRIGPVKNSIIFSGTVPVKDGFKFGSNFRCEMNDNVLGRSLKFGYNVNVITEEER